jgi:hypothetical protein
MTNHREDTMTQPAEMSDLEAASDLYETARMAYDTAHDHRQSLRDEMRELEAELAAADQELIVAGQEEADAAEALRAECKLAGMVRTATGFEKA